MAETSNGNMLINLNQLDRLTKALNSRHEEEFGNLVNIMTQLDEVKSDKHYYNEYTLVKEYNLDDESLVQLVPMGLEDVSMSIALINFSSPISLDANKTYSFELLIDNKPILIEKSLSPVVAIETGELGLMSRDLALGEGIQNVRNGTFAIVDKCSYTEGGEDVVPNENTAAITLFLSRVAKLPKKMSIKISEAVPKLITTDFFKKYDFITDDERLLWNNKSERLNYSEVTNTITLKDKLFSLESEGKTCVVYQNNFEFENFNANCSYEISINFENTSYRFMSNMVMSESSLVAIQSETDDITSIIYQGLYLNPDTQEMVLDSTKISAIYQIKDTSVVTGDLLSIELKGIETKIINNEFLETHRFITEEERDSWNNKVDASYVDDSFDMLFDYVNSEHEELNTDNKTFIGAINELELESFETRASVVALDESKVGMDDLPCYDERIKETLAFNAENGFDGYEIISDIYSSGGSTYSYSLIKISDSIPEHLNLEGQCEFILKEVYTDNGTVLEEGIGNDAYTFDGLQMFEGNSDIESDNEDGNLLFVKEDTVLNMGNVFEFNLTKGIWTFKEMVQSFKYGSMTMSMETKLDQVSIDFIKGGEFKTLDKKYIPTIPGEIVKKGKIEFEGTEEEKVVETCAEIFNDYFTNKAIGRYSHAEGTGTIAYGSYTHTEGNGTVAIGYSSHAEGDETRALGAEGSHAEGTQTCARGNRSHAEGAYTEANGYDCHAEGMGTIAASDHQHTQGKYNIADSNGRYHHIVGNGTSEARSNMHTLDWNGNAWFLGDVFIKGTSQDNAQKLATESSVNSAVGSINSTIESIRPYLVTDEERNVWNNKLDSSYETLNTKDKTIVGAINELELESFETKVSIVELNDRKAEVEYVDSLFASVSVKTEELINQTIENNRVVLSTDKRQKIEMVDGAEIVLPTVTDFTEIHLYFSTLSDLTLIFPAGKYQKTPEIKANKTYEFIFTYIGEWLIGYVEYGN